MSRSSHGVPAAALTGNGWVYKAPWITAEAIDGQFSECPPRTRATELVVSRLEDFNSVALTQGERLTSTQTEM